MLRVSCYGLRAASYGLRVLEPTLDDHFSIGKEIKYFLAVCFGVAEHGVSGPAEGKKAHRCGNADINPDHAG